MKLSRITKDCIAMLSAGKTEVFDLPNRAACESGKSNIYRWGLMQSPIVSFRCSIKDNHLLVVTRK